MSRERELLEKVLCNLDPYNDIFCGTVQEIKDFLSTPEPTQDEEPIGYVEFIEDAGLNFCTLEPTGDYPYQPIYLHPTPRQDFVRLSEEEMQKIVRKTGICWDVARAIEDALEEKNRG